MVPYYCEPQTLDDPVVPITQEDYKTHGMQARIQGLEHEVESWKSGATADTPAPAERSLKDSRVQGHDNGTQTEAGPHASIKKIDCPSGEDDEAATKQEPNNNPSLDSLVQRVADSATITELRKACEQYREELETLESERDEAKADSERIKADLDSLKHERDRLLRSQEENHPKLQGLQGERDELNKEVERMKTEQEALRKRCEGLERYSGSHHTPPPTPGARAATSSTKQDQPAKLGQYVGRGEGTLDQSQFPKTTRAAQVLQQAMHNSSSSKQDPGNVEDEKQLLDAQLARLLKRVNDNYVSSGKLQLNANDAVELRLQALEDSKDSQLSSAFLEKFQQELDIRLQDLKEKFDKRLEDNAQQQSLTDQGLRNDLEAAVAGVKKAQAEMEGRTDQKFRRLSQMFADP